MAAVKEVVLLQLGTGQFLIDKFTADLSDEDFFQPPVPGANHAGWALGHLAVAEDAICAGITGGKKHIPEVTQALFRGGSVCRPGPEGYPARGEITKLFHDARTRTVEALKAFDDGRWDEPSPEGWSRDVFPTLGSLWALQGTHQFWHIGQLTVCRQALGKPRVLGGGD